MESHNVLVGARLVPRYQKHKTLFTGFGAILRIVRTHPDLLKQGLTVCHDSFTVCTDFGNQFTLTMEELLTQYHLEEVDNLVTRYEKQIELLRIALEIAKGN